jgi:hypothetical protein
MVVHEPSALHHPSLLQNRVPKMHSQTTLDPRKWRSWVQRTPWVQMSIPMTTMSWSIRPWMRASRTPTSLAGRSELSTMHVAAAETETVTPPSRAGVAQAL